MTYCAVNTGTETGEIIDTDKEIMIEIDIVHGTISYIHHMNDKSFKVHL